MIEVTLPYPISANRYWRPVKVGAHITIVATKDAKEYRKDVSRSLAIAGVHSPIKGRVSVELDLYPHRPLDWAKRQRTMGAQWDTSVQCIDLTNAEKVILDAMNTIAIEDDKLVWDYHARRCEPDEKGARVVIRVAPWRSPAMADLFAA